MKNYLQKGTSLRVPAPKALKSGEMAAIGVLAGVAGYDAAADEMVELHVEGCYELAKVQNQAWTLGQAIHFNPTSGLCTGTAAAGTLFVGVAIEAAPNPSGVGKVRLNGAAPAAAGA